MPRPTNGSRSGSFVVRPGIFSLSRRRSRKMEISARPRSATPPVIVNRDAGGSIHAFVNRCAHRGALVRRELSGNATEHTCIYHQWCYRLDGSLNSIPFRRGIRGKGGLDAGFDMAAHGLRKLRVESINGALFGTLADDAEPLEDYLG